MDKLKNILIVIPQGSLVLSSITGTYKLFKAAIEFSNADTQLLITGKKKRHFYLDDLFSVTPSVHWREVEKADLIIVPAIKDDIDSVMANNQALVIWLQQQYQKGAEIASLCSGSFLLGEAKLIDGKRATTHWLFAEEFKSRFKSVIFQNHNIITEDDRIYTSGGAYSFLNLIIYLIERFYGKEVAMHLVSIFQIDYYRKSQDAFALFNTQKDHGDLQIKRVQEFVESNYKAKLSSQQLADIAMLGTRTLVRRFKQLTGNTPLVYLQRVRIEAAKRLLTTTQMQIGEVKFEVGYHDHKTFHDLFQRFTGYAPMEYRQKFGLVKLG